MSRNLVLILEDNEDRVHSFHAAVKTVRQDLQLKVWRNALLMITECEPFLSQTCLISLDHDLNKLPGDVADPGDGMDVARWLSERPQMCPIILHSSNYERVWSMHNQLRFAGWNVDRIGPIGDDWIQKNWLPKLKELLDVGQQRPTCEG